jgi:hypothetical protein
MFNALNGILAEPVAGLPVPLRVAGQDVFNALNVMMGKSDGS